MQLGRLEVMEQAQVDYVSKISKIQETEEEAKIDPEEKYKDASSTQIPKTNDVILDNVKFGYDSETKEFFVRIIKGDQEFQYPTEDLMNLKKSLMEAYQSSLQ